jgi:hypothetical protein
MGRGCGHRGQHRRHLRAYAGRKGPQRFSTRLALAGVVVAVSPKVDDLVRVRG